MHVDIIPRRVRYSFEDAPLDWSEDAEFANVMNAQSPLAPYLEPYLNTVMARVRDTLPEHEVQLRNDLNNFIAQESNHYRLHSRFNKLLHAAYPELHAAEKAYWDEYQDWLKNKSLVFNAAYCAGFETIATFQAKFYFEVVKDMFDAGDPRVATMFQWHFAEEFEHRCCAHNAFKAVSGNYFWRIYGAFKCFFHLKKHSDVMKKIVMDARRAKMTPEERAESIKKEKAYLMKMGKYVFPRMLQILVPFYDPAKQTAPASLFTYLKHYENLAKNPDPDIAELKPAT